jgi:hypothetical protein
LNSSLSRAASLPKKHQFGLGQSAGVAIRLAAAQSFQDDASTWPPVTGLIFELLSPRR